MFGKRREVPVTPAPVLDNDSLPGPPAPARGRPAYFGQGFAAEGAIHFDGQLDLDGHFKGDIRAARLIIGPTGCCDGNVVCDSLVIKGSLSGSANCRELEVHTGAQLLADVTYAEIRVTPRARISGRLIHRTR
jgi:cytoskeletal protein CcmA (bactofilin family)